MLRLIAATVLVLHLLFITIVAASSRWMVGAGLLTCYIVLLAVYFWRRAFPLFVLSGLVLYLALLLVAYVALVIGSVQIGKPGNIWFHSFVFLPGILSASAYIGNVIEDRRKQRATAR